MKKSPILRMPKPPACQWLKLAPEGSDELEQQLFALSKIEGAEIRKIHAKANTLFVVAPNNNSDLRFSIYKALFKTPAAVARAAKISEIRREYQQEAAASRAFDLMVSDITQ